MTTTPRIEFAFVVEPDKQADEAWPREGKLKGQPERMRHPLQLDELRAKLGQINVQLKAVNEPELLIEEAYGARLCVPLLPNPYRTTRAPAISRKVSRSSPKNDPMCPRRRHGPHVRQVQ